MIYKDLTKYLAENRVSYQDFFSEAAISPDEFLSVIYSGGMFADEQADSMGEYLGLSPDQFYDFFSVPVMEEYRRRRRSGRGHIPRYSLPLYASIPYEAIISRRYSCKEERQSA